MSFSSSIYSLKPVMTIATDTLLPPLTATKNFSAYQPFYWLILLTAIELMMYYFENMTYYSLIPLYDEG